MSVLDVLRVVFIAVGVISLVVTSFALTVGVLREFQLTRPVQSGRTVRRA